MNLSICLIDCNVLLSSIGFSRVSFITSNSFCVRSYSVFSLTFSSLKWLFFKRWHLLSWFRSKIVLFKFSISSAFPEVTLKIGFSISIMFSLRFWTSFVSLSFVCFSRSSSFKSFCVSSLSISSFFSFEAFNFSSFLLVVSIWHDNSLIFSAHGANITL